MLTSAANRALKGTSTGISHLAPSRSDVDEGSEDRSPPPSRLAIRTMLLVESSLGISTPGKMSQSREIGSMSSLQVGSGDSTLSALPTLAGLQRHSTV